jgi:hypothetical protein
MQEKKIAFWTKETNGIIFLWFFLSNFSEFDWLQIFLDFSW